MKILHILTAPRAEGTPRLVLDWLKCRKNQYVLFLNENPGTLLEDFRQYSNHVLVNKKPLVGKRKFYTIVKIVYKYCKSIKPDLVIAWTTGISQYIHMGAKFAGVKQMITHAGNPPAQSGLIGRYVFSYLTFWTSWLLSVKVIACSDYVKGAFLKIIGVPNIFYSVFNCFDPDKFINKCNGVCEKRKFIMVATFESHKDHATLLEAWVRVEKEHLGYELYLAGSGSMLEYYKKYARELDLKNVFFLGSVNNVEEYLWKSDVFVFSTTEKEGFGTVLLEALAAGLPIIATDVPACAETLQFGLYGTLVPASDSKKLAQAIINSLKNPADPKLIERQISYTKKFTSEHMMHEYLKIAGLSEYNPSEAKI